MTDLDELLMGPAVSREVEPYDTSFDDAGDADVQTLLDGGIPDPSAFLRPVGVTFLGTVFGIEPRRLHKKLKNCPVVGRGTVGRGVGAPLYDFKEAVAYIVDPKIDLETWFSSLSTTTMPPIIMKAFWEAIRTRSRVMEEAGDYWHTADVQAIFGRIVMLIRDSTLLWIEDLPDKADLSNENYGALRRQVNELLTSIQEMVDEARKHRRSPSVAEGIDREILENPKLTRRGDVTAGD